MVGPSRTCDASACSMSWFSFATHGLRLASAGSIGADFVRKIEDRRFHFLRRLGLRGRLRRSGNLDGPCISHLNRLAHERLCSGGQRSTIGAHRNTGATRGLVDLIIDGVPKIHHDPGHRLRLSLELGHPDLCHEGRVHRQQTAVHVVDHTAEVENQTSRIRQSECIHLQRPIGLELHDDAVTRAHGHDFDRGLPVL